MNKLKDTEDIGEVVDRIFSEDSLNACWSKIPSECPLCGKNHTYFSNNANNPENSLCLFCKIDKLKRKLKRILKQKWGRKK